MRTQTGLSLKTPELVSPLPLAFDIWEMILILLFWGSSLTAVYLEKYFELLFWSKIKIIL